MEIWRRFGDAHRWGLGMKPCGAVNQSQRMSHVWITIPRASQEQVERVERVELVEMPIVGAS